MHRNEEFLTYDPGEYLAMKLTAENLGIAAENLGLNHTLSIGDHFCVTTSVPSKVCAESKRAIWDTYLKPALNGLAGNINRCYEKVKFIEIQLDHSLGLLQQVSRKLPVLTKIGYDRDNQRHIVTFEVIVYSEKRASVWLSQRPGENYARVYSEKRLAEQAAASCFNPEEIIITQQNIRTNP